MDCVKCSSLIKTDEQLKCTACQNLYHYVCVGLNENDFKKILPMNKLKWKCPPCKQNKKGNSQTSSPVVSRDSEHSEESHSMINIDAKSLMAHFDSRFNKLESTINSIKSEIFEQLDRLSLTVNAWDTKISAIEATMNTMTDQVHRLELEKETLVAEVNDLKSSLKQIKEDSVRNEQWVRRSNLQIKGVPQTEGENLFQIVRNLAQKCGFPINIETDIDFITREAVKNDVDNKKPKPIIVKLQARYKKDEFLSCVRKLKNLRAGDLGFSGNKANERIYVNDHLSAHNKYLLQLAKNKSREKNYAYCWVRNCTIMVRRSDKSPVIHITSEEALKKIV